MKKLYVTLAAVLAFNIAANAQNIYVADYSANTIDLITSDGNVSILASGLNNPVGIAVNSSGTVYVSDDGSGNIYYNAIQQYNPGTGISFYQHDIVDSWLVKVSPTDTTSKVSYSILTAATAAHSGPAPQPGDQCLGEFSVKQLPWPPTPTAVPPTYTCGHSGPP